MSCISLGYRTCNKFSTGTKKKKRKSYFYWMRAKNIILKNKEEKNHKKVINGMKNVYQVVWAIVDARLIHKKTNEEKKRENEWLVFYHKMMKNI